MKGKEMSLIVTYSAACVSFTFHVSVANIKFINNAVPVFVG
jgi:hypothetical protein